MYTVFKLMEMKYLASRVVLYSRGNLVVRICFLSPCIAVQSAFQPRFSAFHSLRLTNEFQKTIGEISQPRSHFALCALFLQKKSGIHFRLHQTRRILYPTRIIFNFDNSIRQVVQDVSMMENMYTVVPTSKMTDQWMRR